MSLQDKEMIRLLSSIVIIVTLPIMTGILAWGMLRLVDHETRLAVVENNQIAFANSINETKIDIRDHDKRLSKGNL